MRDFVIGGTFHLGGPRQSLWPHEGLVWWGFPPLRDSKSFFSLTWTLETAPGDFITLSWCNHTCSNLGAKFGSRYFGSVATDKLLCWLLYSRKLVGEAEMWSWGCIFLERVSQSKLECLLVLLSVLSDPRLMGYGGDPSVALPAQTVHVFPAAIYWKLTDRQLGKWIILKLLKIWQKKEEPLVISLYKQVMWP